MSMRASKYFREYELEETVGPNGKRKRVYVYHGDLYTRSVTPRQCRLERFLYVLTGTAAAAFLALAMTRVITPNMGGVLSMLSILALVPAIGVIMGALAALFEREKLTRTDYHERVFLLRIMPLLAAALTLTIAAGYGIYAHRALYATECTQALRACALTAAAALLYAGIAARELCVRYTVEKGSKSTEAPERHFRFRERHK